MEEEEGEGDKLGGGGIEREKGFERGEKVGGRGGRQVRGRDIG